MANKYTNKQIFEDLPVGKSLLVSSLPAIAGQLVTLLYNLADTFFVGRVNNPLMISATSLSWPIYSITFPVSIVAASGGGNLVSRLMGMHRNDEARKVAALSIWLSIAHAFLYSLLVFIFMDPLLKFLGASVDTYQYTKDYMMWVCVYGGVPTVAAHTMSTILRNVGHSKESGFSVSMGGVLNIILDPLFMFVILPPGNELVGAAIATFVSNVISCIYCIAVILKIGKEVPIGFSLSDGLPQKSNIATIYRVGLPSATTALLFDVNNMILNKLMSAYGDIAVAAIGMTIKIERFALNTCLGICMGMTPIVAYNYASGDHKRMMDTVVLSRRVGIIISIIATALYEVFAEPLMKIFINDSETVMWGAAFLRRRALAAVVMFLCFYLIHFFQGVGEAKHTFWLAVSRYAMLCIPALFVLDYFLGANGLALSQLAGDILACSISAIAFKKWLIKKNIQY